MFTTEENRAGKNLKKMGFFPCFSFFEVFSSKSENTNNSLFKEKRKNILIFVFFLTQFSFSCFYIYSSFEDRKHQKKGKTKPLLINIY